MAVSARTQTAQPGSGGTTVSVVSRAADKAAACLTDLSGGEDFFHRSGILSKIGEGSGKAGRAARSGPL